MAERVYIAPERYEWAIRRAGLTLDGYIARHPKSCIEKWIANDKQPTIKQVEAFANTVNVPVGYLFLDDVPQEKIPIPMFRGEAGTSHFNLNVYDTVMQILKRQQWLEDYLVENDIDTCPFVGALTTGMSPFSVADEIRSILKLDERWALSMANVNAAIGKLTSNMEDCGVFLVYNGVVGNSTNRRISVDECRGFALVSETAPFVFVNNSDSKTAQMFTLIHELTHILIGVSAGQAGDETDISNDLTERFCDKVAAAFLVPARVLKAVWNDDIGKMAKKFKVSEIVVARCAHDIGLLSDDSYRKFYMSYRNRPLAKKTVKSGDFYLTSVKRVGRTFAIHVRNAVNSRQLSYTDAYRLTGLYGRTYDRFMNDNI